MSSFDSSKYGIKGKPSLNSGNAPSFAPPILPLYKTSSSTISTRNAVTRRKKGGVGSFMTGMWLVLSTLLITLFFFTVYIGTSFLQQHLEAEYDHGAMSEGLRTRNRIQKWSLSHLHGVDITHLGPPPGSVSERLGKGTLSTDDDARAQSRGGGDGVLVSSGTGKGKGAGSGVSSSATAASAGVLIAAERHISSSVFSNRSSNGLRNSSSSTEESTWYSSGMIHKQNHALYNSMLRSYLPPVSLNVSDLQAHLSSFSGRLGRAGRVPFNMSSFGSWDAARSSTGSSGSNYTMPFSDWFAKHNPYRVDRGPASSSGSSSSTGSSSSNGGQSLRGFDSRVGSKQEQAS